MKIYGITAAAKKLHQDKAWISRLVKRHKLGTRLMNRPALTMDDIKELRSILKKSSKGNHTHDKQGRWKKKRVKR